MKLRIKFEKSGCMKFIGHLDIMRYFQKAIRRSGIDIAYSTGFSPHQIMSFAAPLGVGLESTGEYFDIEVNSITNSSDMVLDLNRAMADGIRIISIRKLPDNVENAMASVKAARYQIRIRKGYEVSIDFKTELPNFFAKENIVVEKQTKKSTKELDLKPFIFEWSYQNDVLELLVDASSSGNIKPTLVLNAFYKEHNLTLGEFDLEITRIEAYGSIEDEDGNITYIPLEDFGDEF